MKRLITSFAVKNVLTELKYDKIMSCVYLSWRFDFQKIPCCCNSAAEVPDFTISPLTRESSQFYGYKWADILGMGHHHLQTLGYRHETTLWLGFINPETWGRILLLNNVLLANVRKSHCVLKKVSDFAGKSIKWQNKHEQQMNFMTSWASTDINNLTEQTKKETEICWTCICV